MGGLRSLAPAFAGLLLIPLACQKPKPTAQGKDVFASLCAKCHGADGSGGLPVFDGGPSPRNFRDHAFQTSRSDADLVQTIRSGKGASMPPFGSTLSDEQIGALVTQIRSFDPENR